MQEAFAPKPGTDLVALRDALGVSQQDLAAELGVHRVTIARWEAAREVKAFTYLRYEAACRAVLDRAAGGAQ